MSTTTAIRSTSPSPTLCIEWQPVDESVRSHVSARYWQWRELFERDPDARITQHPDVVLAETEANSPLVLCEAKLGEELIALAILAPKRTSLRQAGGFGLQANLHGFRLVGNRLLGQPSWDHAREVLAACATFAEHEQATFLLIEDLEESAPLMALARSLAEDQCQVFSPTGFQERWLIEFPSSPLDYWQKFSSKSRNTFRRKQKKIGAARLASVTQPDQVAEFLAFAHEISKKTWQSRKLGLRIRNDDAEQRHFTGLAMLGALRSYLLFVDEQPVAFLIGTQHKGLFSYEEVGYDVTYADRSPGQVLLLMVLDDLLAHDPPKLFDFGGGDADYKRLFATSTSSSGNVWLVPPCWRARMWMRYLAVCRQSDRCLRSLIKRFGLTTRLRQILRGKLSHRWLGCRNSDMSARDHATPTSEAES